MWLTIKAASNKNFKGKEGEKNSISGLDLPPFT